MVKRIALSRKMRALVAAGAVPSTIIAGIGDFFSAKGGWLLPLALGLVAIAVLIGLWGIGTDKVARASEGDLAMEGWWDGPYSSQLGVWVIATIAASSFFLSAWSHARAAEGGVLGSNFRVVEDAQQQLGLLTGIEENTRRTASATAAIRDTVKRETSDDPMKEINNKGQAWSERGLLEAIRRQDLESVELYLKGRMTVDNTDNFVFASIYNRAYAHLDLFDRYGVKASRESCRLALFHADSFAFNPENGNAKPLGAADLKSSSTIDPDAVRTYRTLCSTYTGLPGAILTKETCKKPDHACGPDEPVDHSDPVEVAMAPYRQSRAACTLGMERMNAEHAFCKRLLNELD